MCDYSLHAVKNRLAVEGEQLIINKFHTGSKGLASATTLELVKLGRFARFVNWLCPGTINNLAHHLTAVCVPPGARLRLDRIPKAIRKKHGVRESEEVVFTQLTYEPFRYRDAFKFRNGAEILIQKFDEGVRIEILALALEESETKPIAAAATANIY